MALDKKMLLAVLMSSAGQIAVATAQDAEPDDTDEYVDEIVVTVERREQGLQDYAGTAAALSGDELKALGITNINDIDGKIPGVSIANNQGNIEVYIRGVGSSNNTELGDPAAATHFNDVYVPRPSGFASAFFDIERVEVNIGPQGTLRGRNATAGSVNIIPWKPGLGTFDAGIEASYGNFNQYTVEGYVNVPVTDYSAFRIAGFRRERDSFLNSVTPDSSELGLDIPTSEDEGVGVGEAADDFGLRAAFLIEPTENLTFTLTGDYLGQNGSGYTGINFANPLGNGIDPASITEPRNVFGRGFTPSENTDHWGIKGEIEYEGDWFNIEYIGSFRDLVFDYEFVTPVSPDYPGALDNISTESFDDFSRIRFITDSESIIQELRFYGDAFDDKLAWTVGGFYFNEEQRTFLGTTGDRNPFFQGIEFNQRTDTESYSFYGDATYSITDRFRLTGGVRYTSDVKERFGINARYAFGFGGGPDFNCCFTNGVGLGTEGFEFAALDRTIFNPDTNSDGSIDPGESLAFFFDGVSQFGERDGFEAAFPNQLPIDDAIQVIPVDQRPLCDGVAFAFRGDCSNFVPEFNGRIPFTLAPFNSSFALQNGRLDNDFVDWRVRLEYDVSDDNLVYALVSTGNKSGGFNDNIEGTEGLNLANLSTSAPQEFTTDTLAPTYGPETLTLYELGSKNEFDVGEVGVTLNLSAFYYDYKDLQLSTLLSTAQALDFTGVDLTTLDPDILDNLGGQVVGFTFNASDAEIYGAQIETGLQFPGDLNWSATLLWLPEANVVNSQEIQDSRFQADVDPDNSVNRPIDGNRLIRTPKYQLNTSITKAIETSFGLIDGVVSVGYRSSQNMTIFNGEDFSNPDNPQGRLNDEVGGYVTIDMGAGVSFGEANKYRVEAYVNNLTDIERPQAIIITQFDNTRFFNAPRTYGVRLRARL
ncbi:MAG: TonB-dependent receptor [Pseudomonadota bacterium]